VECALKVLAAIEAAEALDAQRTTIIAAHARGITLLMALNRIAPTAVIVITTPSLASAICVSGFLPSKIAIGEIPELTQARPPLRPHRRSERGLFDDSVWNGKHRRHGWF